jgi:hypothetical protein
LRKPEEPGDEIILKDMLFENLSQYCFGIYKLFLEINTKNSLSILIKIF